MVAEAGVDIDELVECGDVFGGGRFVVEAGFRGGSAQDGVG